MLAWFFQFMQFAQPWKFSGHYGAETLGLWLFHCLIGELRYFGILDFKFFTHNRQQYTRIFRESRIFLRIL